ncbi:hypothetical protein F2P81_015444 [Scophthalmus maximus]|uniref:Uncharacterized protein n=1 Tax=Scophthalmus maximus TaxID=52904 RepID=A0A6A4SQ12_SCOMX|nr:hypothetical protein F2P81_015444 [Scophthalmus maximus]
MNSSIVFLKILLQRRRVRLDSQDHCLWYDEVVRPLTCGYCQPTADDYDHDVPYEVKHDGSASLSEILVSFVETKTNQTRQF